MPLGPPNSETPVLGEGHSQGTLGGVRAHLAPDMAPVGLSITGTGLVPCMMFAVGVGAEKLGADLGERLSHSHAHFKLSWVQGLVPGDTSSSFLHLGYP